jgi:uncharacterized protein (DUF4213/DUF364 family)
MLHKINIFKISLFNLFINRPLISFKFSQTNHLLTQINSQSNHKLIEKSKKLLNNNKSNKILIKKMSVQVNESLTRALFRGSDAVCFDVDSTVCRDEAIDEIAKFAGKEKEVMEM